MIANTEKNLANSRELFESYLNTIKLSDTFFEPLPEQELQEWE